jgi:hypothetical protein
MQQPVYQNPNTLTPEKAYSQTTILWGAMLVSQFMFLLLIYLTKPKLFGFSFSEETFPPEMAVTVNTIAGILAVLALIVFTLSFVLKARFLRLAVRDKKVGIAQSGYILAYALCEAVSLFGLLTVFLLDFQYFFLWFVLGILGLLLHFPRRDPFHAAAFTGIHLKED